jgi:hypothetical protein
MFAVSDGFKEMIVVVLCFSVVCGFCGSFWLSAFAENFLIIYINLLNYI